MIIASMLKATVAGMPVPPVKEREIVSMAVESTAEEPSLGKPALEEPVLEKPVLEPAVEEPAVEEPAVEEPVVEEPVVEEPLVEEPEQASVAPTSPTSAFRDASSIVLPHGLDQQTLEISTAVVQGDVDVLDNCSLDQRKMIIASMLKATVAGMPVPPVPTGVATEPATGYSAPLPVELPATVHSARVASVDHPLVALDEVQPVKEGAAQLDTAPDTDSTSLQAVATDPVEQIPTGVSPSDAAGVPQQVAIDEVSAQDPVRQAPQGPIVLPNGLDRHVVEIATAVSNGKVEVLGECNEQQRKELIAGMLKAGLRQVPKRAALVASPGIAEDTPCVPGPLASEEEAVAVTEAVAVNEVVAVTESAPIAEATTSSQETDELAQGDRPAVGSEADDAEASPPSPAPTTAFPALPQSCTPLERRVYELSEALRKGDSEVFNSCSAAERKELVAGMLKQGLCKSRPPLPDAQSSRPSSGGQDAQPVQVHGLLQEFKSKPRAVPAVVGSRRR